MSKGNVPAKNEFFDIKPLKDWTIFVFPISMSKISNSQDAKNCIKWINYFGDKKAGELKLGLNVIYGDFLYFNSDESAKKLKDSFMASMNKHKNALKKLIFKNRKKLQIQHAFHFESWGNIYLGFEGDFYDSLLKIKSLYKEDKLFRKYIKEDSKFFERDLDKNQLDFFLEEHLMFYLIINKKINFRNEYVQGREKDILICYPGVPPKASVYLCQKNPFNFKTDSKFIGQYNLENKKFYDYNNLDLETWDYK